MDDISKAQAILEGRCIECNWLEPLHDLTCPMNYIHQWNPNQLELVFSDTNNETN